MLVTMVAQGTSLLHGSSDVAPWFNKTFNHFSPKIHLLENHQSINQVDFWWLIWL